MIHRTGTLRFALVPFCVFFESLPLYGSPQTVPKLSVAQPASAEERSFAAVEALIEAKDVQKAESLLDSAIAQGTPPGRAYFRMGRIYFDHEAWTRAATYLEKSLQTQVDNDQAHLLLGLAYRELKQPERAEKELLEALRQNPRSDVNAYFAGQQLLMEEKFEAALPYLYEAVKLNPQNASAYRALGMTQVHLGNYGLAVAYYRKAVDTIGKSSLPDIGTLLDLAFILLLGHDRANIEEALRLAQRVAKLQPKSGEAHYLMGKALTKTGRVKEAVPELELAAKFNPEDSKAHFQLALAYAQLGEREKARAEREVLAKTKQRAGQQGTASGSILPHTTE